MLASQGLISTNEAITSNFYSRNVFKLAFAMKHLSSGIVQRKKFPLQTEFFNNIFQGDCDISMVYLCSSVKP